MVKKLSSLLDKSVQYSLVAIVFSMLFFSVSSIFLRWFGITFLWIEPLIRHLVFITAFLGAMLATATGSHIGIEILGKYLESVKKEKALFILTKVTTFITIFALAWLAYSGYLFFLVEKEYGQEIFWGLHSSAMVFIIPAGFFLMFLRSVLSFLDFSREEKLS